MASVVADSGSIYSTYIATIDHLPCDIVRSLWLVQSCNLSAQKEKETLHHMLQGENAQTLLNSAKAHTYYQGGRRLRRLTEEATAEMQSLCDQLIAHEQLVSKEIAQLQTLADVPAKQDTLRAEKLRAQLVQHYKEKPLASQVEALQEQERVLRDLGRVVITKTPGKLTGLKIVFKLGGKRGGRREKKGERERARERAREQTREQTRNQIRNQTRTQTRNQTREQTRSQTREETQKQTREETRDRHTRETQRQTRVAAESRRAGGRQRENDTLDSTHKRALAEKIPEMEPVHVIKPTMEEPERYCFCKQPSFGDMIACDYEKCPNGEWFHYKCVGLLGRAEALKYTKQKWFCSSGCREKFELRPKRRKRKAGW